MRRRPARKSPFRDAMSPLRVVAPSLAAFGAGLGLLQLAPMVQAATNPPPPVVKPMPKLAAPDPALKQYPIARTMKFAAPVKFGDWAWNETRGPLTGPMLVLVDIKSETLSVYRGGHQIGATRIIYGDDAKPTPVGVFPITQKKEKHRSSLFVDAPMPYMLRMTPDGISVHGADKVEPIYATNGCIGIPNGFAKRLFAVVALGDRVVVTRAKEVQAGDVVPTA